MKQIQIKRHLPRSIWDCAYWEEEKMDIMMSNDHAVRLSV